MMEQNYLVHHGVKGMKWGVRRYQNEDGSLTTAGEGRYSYGKVHGLSPSKASKAGSYRANKKYGKKLEKAKTTKRAVKEYSNQYDKAVSARDKADAEWAKTKELRKKMGKTSVTRFISAMKGTSAEAKAYSKQWDKWESAQDSADTEWAKAIELRKKTGKTAVSRVLNNMRYM